MQFKRDAFISYSHRRDAALARALQDGLHHLARPWARRSAIKVFRDTTSLSAHHDLWSAILTELEQTRYFIYLASPEAAASRWVRQEIDFWLTRRPVDRFLIAVSDGSVVWDPRAGDFDWDRTDALPDTLRGRFPTEPLWVDFTEIRRREKYSLRQADFRDAVATLAAPLHGRSKDEIDSEDIRQHRLATRWRRATVTGLAILLATALVAGGLAWQQRNTALERARVSASQAMAARAIELVDTDPRSAAQLALQAHATNANSESTRALAGAVYANRHVERHLRGGSNTVYGHSGSSGGPSTRVAVSRDGSTLAYFSYFDNSGIHVYDIGQGAELQRLTTGHWPNGGGWLELSADGRLLAVEVTTNTVEVWDVRQARLARTIRAGDPSGLANAFDGLYDAALSPDGNWLAATYNTTGVQARQLSVWDLRTGAAVEQSATAAALQFDEQNRLISSERGNHRRFDPRMRTWAAQPWRSGSGYPIAVAGDGRAVIGTGSNPHDPAVYASVELWNLAGGRRTGSVDAGRVNVVLPAAAPATVIAAFDTAVTVYDTRWTEQRVLGGFRWPVTSLSSSADGRWVAAASTDGAVSLFDAQEPALGGPLSAGSTPPQDAVRLLQSGIYLRPLGHRTELWQEGLGGFRKAGSIAALLGQDGTEAAISVDGSRAVVLTETDATRVGLSLWDLRSGQQIGQTRMYTNPAQAPRRETGVRFLADNRHVVAVSGDGVLIIDTGDWSTTVLRDAGTHPDRVAVSADGSTVAVTALAGDAVAFWRWDGADLAEIRTVPLVAERSVEADIVLSGAGAKAAVVDSDGHLRLVDVADGTFTDGVVMREAAGAVFSRDARMLVQLSWGRVDTVLQFWDSATAEPVGSWTVASADGPFPVLGAAGAEIVTFAGGGYRRWTADVAAWRQMLCAALDDSRLGSSHARYLEGLERTDPCA